MAVLGDKRLVVVSGKGGVGKSSISAALALSFARSGLRTLLCEVNARERVSALLGRPEVGPTIGLLEENLWAVNVQPAEAMREYALMILRFESIYDAVFENRLVRYFLRFIPSLQELVMLGKILFHLREKREDGSWRFDRIVIDAPATGHAVTFLAVPQVILDTVPPGQLSREAQWMRDLLVDPKVTAAVLVSMPEEMPVNETIELDRALRERVRVAPQLVVLNAFIPGRFDEGDLSSLGGSPALLAAARAHFERSALSAAAKERLAREVGLPVHPVRRIFRPTFGRPAIEDLAGELAPVTGGAP